MCEPDSSREMDVTVSILRTVVGVRDSTAHYGKCSRFSVRCSRSQLSLTCPASISRPDDARFNARKVMPATPTRTSAMPMTMRNQKLVRALQPRTTKQEHAALRVVAMSPPVMKRLQRACPGRRVGGARESRGRVMR